MCILLTNITAYTSFIVSHLEIKKRMKRLMRSSKESGLTLLNIALDKTTQNWTREEGKEMRTGPVRQDKVLHIYTCHSEINISTTQRVNETTLVLVLFTAF